MERGDWSIWLLLALGLQVLLLALYLVQVARERRGSRSDLTRGGMVTALGLALVTVGMLPTMPVSAFRAATVMGCALVLFAPWIRARLGGGRRATSPREG